MNSDNRNLLLAVALSMAVLFGWQVFVVGPELEKEAAQQRLLAEQQAVSQDAGTPQAVAASEQPQATGTASQPESTAVIADTAKRILIEAPQLSGSFSLQGTRIDDIILTDYRETLDADSDNIHFLKKLSSNAP